MITIKDAADLRRIYDAVGPRRGWDFSRLRIDADPPPWDYSTIARSYIRPTDHVLDVGTGGGEVFLRLADAFAEGLGTDLSAEMIATARENVAALARSDYPDERRRAERVSFAIYPAQALDLPPDSFDVILDRNAAVFVDQIVPLLRPGGFFITQQVAGRNSQSIYDAFGWAEQGWASSGDYWQWYWREHHLAPQDVGSLASRFVAAGCELVERRDYDIDFFFQEIESLVFFVRSVPLPEDLDPERHWPQMRRLIEANTTPRGIRTNEHRELLIVRKPV